MALFYFQQARAADALSTDLRIPQPGDHTLLILSPNLLELFLINTKQPDPARVDSWDWVNDQGTFAPSNLSSIKVIINGQTNSVSGTGFKRRPIYAPLEAYDLRIANHLYLQLDSPIADDQSVQVINNGTLWPTNMLFAATTDPLRYNPAIHVNQEGYVPSFPKKAIIGYYLGSLGELAIRTNTFSLVDAQNGLTVYQGTLTLRPDVGYNYTPTPYQNVYEADFSSFTTPGEYRLFVPGMGASLTFRIDAGIAMAFARTYALGMFHQRSGFNVAMPFTRFIHAADHTAPAAVPTNGSAPFAFTWEKIRVYASEVNPDNPPQTAPRMTNSAAQLYPFVNRGPLTNSGGHFEAADYNRVTFNGAKVIHTLMFAVDSLPGVGQLDNLGIPESGDGVSDLLQEAKWEADFLAKMQDTDGGFYYARYPINREYENNVLPENGDPEVVWPKNTSATAAAVAALAQCASSPRFKQAYPQVASNYWTKALSGWHFLTNAIRLRGLDGVYQKIQHFGDFGTDRDDLAWAACEMFLATGNTNFQAKLFAWYPDPTDLTTFKWGWWRMFESYGNAARDYAFAVTSGRLNAGQINQSYLAKCITLVMNCGDDYLAWSQNNAYGSSLPETTKAYQGGGWYFSLVQAFDLVVAYQLNQKPEYLDAILLNMNYEGGCNPVNQTYVTGLGWKRQRTIVDQYSVNDQHIMPKDGVPIGNFVVEFYNTWTYGSELGALTFASDYTDTAPYPFYDRWCDDWNVSTEGSTTDTVRSFAVTAWLAAQTSLTNQAWRFTNATIAVPSGSRLPNQPLTVGLQVAEPDLTGTRIVWEARGQEPSFGGTSYTFTPGPNYGPYWIEVEIQWPDGRRAFATNSVMISPDSPPVLSKSQRATDGGFSFQLAGTPDATYVIQASVNFTTWLPVSTNTLPPSGVSQITYSNAAAFSQRYYRAVKL